MELKIAVLPGDGIGPEITNQSLKVLAAIEQKFNHKFTFTRGAIGADAMEHYGTPLPDETVDICYHSDAILYGACGDPKFATDPTALMRPEQGILNLRRILGLHTNIRPIKTYNALLHCSTLKQEVIRGVDFVIFRELTGGIYYSPKEEYKENQKAMDICAYSPEEISRIAIAAFKAASERKKHLTLVDKSNVLATSKLWRQTVLELSKDFPEVELDFMYIDNAAMRLIQNPKEFDVILTENMFGDILSGQGAMIAGSIGLLASASIGDSAALFEPTHGSYPSAAGKNIANPLGSILSTAMLLEHFKLHQEASLIRQAIDLSINMNLCTQDLNPIDNYSTANVGNFICNYILEENTDLGSRENMTFGQSTII
ncbi:MAG: 3-isopropylmalate dehydrogenase [Flavobacteriaceae bacterium]